VKACLVSEFTDGAPTRPYVLPRVANPILVLGFRSVLWTLQSNLGGNWIGIWERRSSFGELVMQDSSPFRWLEERGPACQLIAVIDDATSRFYARFTEHDTTEENLRTFGEWVRRYGRPIAHYTDKNSIFRTSAGAPLGAQLRGEKARSHFGRALRELGIEWIAAHSPQAKGRIERLFETLQDRLVKEMRLAGIDSIAAANHFLEMRFFRRGNSVSRWHLARRAMPTDGWIQNSGWRKF